MSNSLAAILASPMDLDLPRGQCALADMQADLIHSWKEYCRCYEVEQDGRMVPLERLLRQWRRDGAEALGNSHLMEGKSDRCRG